MKPYENKGTNTACSASVMKKTDTSMLDMNAIINIKKMISLDFTSE